GAEGRVRWERRGGMGEGRIEQVGTPREIYERPATAFVAGFVGRANLLRGRLEAEGQVRLGDGLALRVAETRGAALGRDVAVSIRPHRIAVSREAAGAAGFRDRGWNGLPGTVGRVVYFGDTLDVQVARAAGGPVLRLSAPPEAGLAVGQAVALGIPPDACIVLPVS